MSGEILNPEVSYNLSGEDRHGRREHLKRLTSYFAGLVLAAEGGWSLINPSVARAQQMVLTERPWTGRTKLWWPNSEETAARYGIYTLHGVGGPLHVYDEAHRIVYDQSTNAREWEEYRANEHLKNHPERRGWSGYCRETYRETYIVGFMEPIPPDSINPQVRGIGSDRSTTEGLLVAMHTADPALLYAEDRAGIERLLSLHPHRRVVVDAPEQTGRWFRAVYGVSATQFLGTNFGYADKVLPKSMIVSAQLPYYIPYKYEEAVPSEPVNEKLLQESRELGVNPFLNHDFIRFLVYQTPLEGGYQPRLIVFSRRDIFNRVASVLRQAA